MAIPFVGSSTDLFPRLGRVGKVALLAAGAQDDIAAELTDLMGRYTGLDESITGTLAVQRDSLTRSLAASLLAQLATVAGNTVSAMVKADQPARAANPVAEVIRQMLASGDTVKACAVTASASADGGNTGDHAVVVTTVRGDGRTLENIIAEAGRLVVSADSRTGGTGAGAEQLTYTGVPNAAGVWDWDYPQGSGATAQLVSADAVTGRNSALRNGGWDAWTSGTPDYWVKTGTLAEEASTVFGAGAKSVKVVAGDSATLTQTFNSTAGTTSQLNPLSSLAFSFRVRGSASLSGGTVVVSLVDGSGTTLDDDLAVAQSVSFNLNGIGTSWVARSGTLRLPRIIPTSGYKIRVAVNAPAGGNAFLDHMAARPVAALYTGGPGVAVFGGATPAALGDGWTVTGANDRAGAAFGLTWQALWGRLFGVDNLLPSTSGTPTVADTLTTA